MIAFEPSVLVRFLADDNKAQADLAEQLMQSHTVFIPRTVVLESEWVLRSAYKKTREQITRFIEALLDSENTIIEEHNSVKQALGWYRLGADFADALHLAACGTAVMHTFDRSFCRGAREAGIAPLVRVLEVNARTDSAVS